MQVPKVSIGMPVYNGEKYFRVAVNSLLEQDYTDFELIIGDNASKDATSYICREFARKDPRIRYYRNPTNIGAAANFQRVLLLAQGEFFKWATYDDVHLPGNLRRCVEVLSAAPPEVILVVPRIFLIDEEGASLMDEEGLPLARIGLAPGDTGPERLATRAKKPHLRLAEVLPKLKWSTSQFGLFRTSALRRTRGIDSFHASDRVLLAEVALLGEIWEIDEPLFAFRYHSEISTNINKTHEEYALWLDSLAKGRALKRRIISLEYARSIKRLPLSGLERVLCLGVVAYTWYQQRRRKRNPGRPAVQKGQHIHNAEGEADKH